MELFVEKNRLVCVVAFLMVGILISPANAQKKKKSSAKASTTKLFSLNTDIGLAYDDNVINYSEADLGLIGDSTKAGKFAIKSKNDWITTIKIQPQIKSKLLFGRTAWVDASFEYFFYFRNDVRRYSKLSISGRQYVIPGGYVDLTYAYVPNYYYRNYLKNSIWMQAKFKKHYIKLETGYQVTKELKADLAYIFQNRIFNSEFTERNTKSNLVTAGIDYLFTKQFKASIIYDFESAIANGANNPDPNVIDVSYDAWDISLGLRHYSPLFGHTNPEVYGVFQYRKIKFQSIKVRDEFRFGRNDNNYQFRLGASAQLFYGVRTGLEYKAQKKRADMFFSSREPEINYNSNTISIDFSRTF